MARILFADDERDLLDVFAEILRDEGHEVEVAVDGLDALRTIKAWRPDLAILDIDMPTMTGPSIAAELSKGEEGLATIPVVLLSGNPNVDRVATDMGIQYSVTKPVAPEELIKVLESALARRGERRETDRTCVTAGRDGTCSKDRSPGRARLSS
jgi:CheY-like chemotaxis protein